MVATLKVFFRNGHFTLAVLFALALLTRSVEAAKYYEYPYRDPYLATATSSILDNDGVTAGVESDILRIPGLPGRNRLPGLEGRGDVSVAFYRQAQAAPLVFILSGLGSNPYFGVGPYLAGLFYRAGSHVIILPSPMNWNFALSASRSGAPGHAPSDARDVYEVMQKTLTMLRERYDVKPTVIRFVGVSLGALEGAYLSVIDADEGKIGIANYLLINPPVDADYAVKKIDEWSRLASKFGPEKSQELVSRALAIVDSFSDQRPDDPAVIRRLAKKFAGFTTEELQFLIAETLQSQLHELVFVTQAIHDQKVLAAPKEDIRKRLREAKGFKLVDYNRMIAAPIWRRRLGDLRAEPDGLLEQSSLTRVMDRLRSNPKVHILHNVDDFLAERKSIESLKETLGDQVTLYPYGGHLGNLWYPENKKTVLGLIQPDLQLARVLDHSR
jgi:predicted alpha/beta-fold hydrolase